VAASPAWEDASPAKRTSFAVINPLLDTVNMENMLTAVKLVKVIIRVFHELCYADTALLSFELFRIAPRRNHCLELPE